MEITELLDYTVAENASDLHLSAGLPPLIRVDGTLKPSSFPRLDQQNARRLIEAIMTAEQRQVFAETLEADFSFSSQADARFRANVFMQDRGIGAAIRCIPAQIKTLEDLQLPDTLRALATKPRGLVLVTGATGSGKSTTLAALIDYLNTTQEKHILTIEDPIEYVHQSKMCLINQREVNRDTLSFQRALRSAFREDPDIILIGELRDTETIRLALTAAETGHLVFATLHTNSATKSINRILEVFPGDEQSLIRTLLSESLQGVISQFLLKRQGQTGRVIATEIMICNAALRNMIREGKVAQMYSAIQTGSHEGMYTLDQNLQTLVRRHDISEDTAREIANDRSLF
jgi:twitching motility protein PilT